MTTNSSGDNDNVNEALFVGHFETLKLPSKWGNNVPYVIITNNTTIGGEAVGNLVGKFQKFADLKNRKGTPAKVVPVNTILKTYKGVDAVAKVRNFIKDAYQNWGT